MRTIHLSGLQSLVGQTVGRSDPLTVSQDMVDAFADATGDHQWIHVDPERAAKGPFGRTIAHGFLTLSLIPRLVGQVLRVDGVGLTVNYGLDRVRFPAPVPVGSAVVAELAVQEVMTVDGGAQQVVNAVSVTVQGETKPSCVAEWVLRHHPAG